MSDRPTLTDFEAALDNHWHGRPPASLEDVMALYGVLALAESGSGVFRTPTVLAPFVDDGRLVTITVDLTENEPLVEDIDVDTLREDHVPKLAYSHKSSGRGAKYSLTQIGSKTGNDAEGVASTIMRRVRTWTGKDSVQSLTGDDGHPDGWIITELATVFEKDSETLKAIKEDIVSLLPAEDSIPTALTVRLRIDTDSTKSIDGDGEKLVWPADVGVLDEAMHRYASANDADKNIDTGSSEGPATGVVTGEHGRTVGTPESPLGVFSVKHPDAQPGLRKEASWRHYPVQPDTAQLFSKGQDLIDRCVFRPGSMETYALPYFGGEITPEKADALYLAIQSIDQDGESPDPPMAQVTYHLTENEDESIRELAKRELRFYTITMPIGDDKHIVSESPAADVHWVAELSDALAATTNGPTLDPVRGGFKRFDNWPLLTVPSERAAARRVGFALVTGHQFTDAAFAYRDGEEADDFRRIVDHRLISGDPIEASTLFDEYMRRYDDAAEDGEVPPHQVVVQQLVHLETLSRAGLLTGINTPIEYPDTDMTPNIDTSDLAAIREHRLDEFLDRPLFDDGTRRAAAVAGVLIGQISWHQESQRSIGRPLDAGTRGDELTANSLENAITAALEKSKIYAQEESHKQDFLFPETVDRLLDTTDSMPTDWDIDKRELQFCYVLGHAHGRRSMDVAFDLYDGGDSQVDDPGVTENSATN